GLPFGMGVFDPLAAGMGVIVVQADFLPVLRLVLRLVHPPAIFDRAVLLESDPFVAALRPASSEPFDVLVREGVDRRLAGRGCQPRHPPPPNALGTWLPCRRGRGLQ